MIKIYLIPGITPSQATELVDKLEQEFLEVGREAGLNGLWEGKLLTGSPQVIVPEAAGGQHVMIMLGKKRVRPKKKAFSGQDRQRGFISGFSSHGDLSGSLIFGWATFKKNFFRLILLCGLVSRWLNSFTDHRDTEVHRCTARIGTHYK